MVRSDKNPKVLVSRLLAEKADLPKLYLACGEDDFLKTENDDFAAFLKEKGVDHTYVTGPGAHEWDFWDTYIKKALEWLPLEDAVSGRSSGNVGLE